jgi:hypothetical protein
VGKIGLQHLEVVNELELRGVLVPPLFRLRYLEFPDTNARLEKLRSGARLIDLAKTRNWRKR